MNQLVHWNDEYSVHIEGIDQQHKKLFDLINLLYDSYTHKADVDSIDQILNELSDYAFVHFKNEETYFSNLSESRVTFHLSEHKFFLDKIDSFREEYKSQNLAIQYELIVFLKDWLTNHILRTDKQYTNLEETQPRR